VDLTLKTLVPLYIPVRGLQSAAEPSRNGGWAASHALRAFSVGGGALITGAQLEMRT
jgi:hypothetical protein